MDQNWGGSVSTSSACLSTYFSKVVEPNNIGSQSCNARWPAILSAPSVINRVAQVAFLSVVCGSTPSTSIAAANITNLQGLNVLTPEQISSTSSKSQTREVLRNSLINKIYTLKNASWVKDEDRQALENTVIDVGTFLQIIPNDIPLPELTYTDDGEILLFWNMSKAQRAELSFSSEFGNGYALYIFSRFEPGKEELISSEFPTDLLNYLKS